MATPDEIERIARSVFDEAVPGFVEEIHMEDSADHSGEPAIKITALTRPGAARPASLSVGRNTARARLQRRLSDVGETRFAYIRFVQSDEFRDQPEDDGS